MIIDCISDLHGFRPKLEGGDLLIVAGDLTARDTRAEHVQITDWMHAQKYKCVVFIAGNHDGEIQDIPRRADHVYYLCDSGCEFEGLKIWGSPWTKTFKGMNPKCKAFTKDTEEELSERWEKIPDDIDVLITHSPPYGILDEVEGHHGMLDQSVGSCSLRSRLEYIQPRLHVFGHIHAWGGKKMVLKKPGHGTENNTMCVNASHVDENYEPVNKPIRIEL